MNILYRVFLIILVVFCLSSCNRDSKYYQGYVDSKFRFISSNFSGVLIKLDVSEGDMVKKGDALFNLEPYPEQWSIDEDLAKISIAKSQVDAFTIRSNASEQKNIRRQKLKLTNFADQEELETASSDFAIAKAQLDEAKDNLKIHELNLYESQWSLAKKNMVSNMNAMVFDIYYYENEFVPAGRPILSLLSPEDIKIIFFVPEKIISQIKIGQKIHVNCDGCKKQYNAKISFISTKSEYTPPIIYSKDTQDKLVFLVEARSDLESNKELHPGQPVYVTLGQEK